MVTSMAEWVRIRVVDIPDDGEEGINANTDPTKAIKISLDEIDNWFISANAAGKITTGASAVLKLPTNFQMRPGR